MICSTAIRAVVFTAVMGYFAPAFAQTGAKDSVAAPLPFEEVVDQGDNQGNSASDNALGFQTAADAPVVTSQAPVEELETLTATTDAPEAALSIEHIDITVENKAFSVRSRRTDTGGVLIEASPIFTHLKGKVSIEGTVLSYRRFQDGALLGIDMATGAASINEQVRGFLPGWKAREVADTWLGPNSIAFLTGTEPKENKVGGWAFTLSEQLRPQFDLDLWIEGAQITNPAVEPRTIGPVLLIPLEEVTEALGHVVERLENNVISVRRLQDSTTILLNLSNGLVTVNNTPRGVTPNISFADPDTLLLPFSAVESLTGTHIELAPGSTRIDIRLDDRLGGGVLPGERVDDEVAETGFTPESLDFRLSDRGPINLTFSSRFRSLNSQLNYVSAGGFDDVRELQPAFAGLNVQSLDGWVGSIGDANTRLRELSGVGASRIRGVTWRKQTGKKGDVLAVAVGARANGAVQITEDASRPTFGGFVAGARLLKANRSQDIGVSLSLTPGADAGRVVVGGQKSVALAGDRGKLGLEQLFVAADAGLFAGPQGVKVDVRSRVQARGRITRQISYQGNLDYEGGQFSRSDDDVADAAAAGRALPGTTSRFSGSVSTDWRAAQAWGPIDGVAAGVRVAYARTGGVSDSSSTSISASLNSRVPALDLNLSTDIDYSYSSSDNGERSTSRNVNLRASKRFAWGNFQTTYTDTDSSASGRINRSVSSLTLQPIRRQLGEGASITAGPSASVVVANGDVSTRFGATVSANSGQKFGDRFNVQGQFSALQSIAPEISDTQLFASIGSSFRITQNLQIEANYVEAFANGRDFGISLRGRVAFNEPRKYSRPKDGLGILTGGVYFDRNRDGIRQPDEPGISNVRVQVSGTRLSLQVDRDGRFTIQNIPEGLYSLVVDRRSLPLGLVVADDVFARATIGEGRITDLDIPIIASGQVRGSIFVDDNGNGATDPGERRVEGMYITLKSLEDTGETVSAGDDEKVTQISASFGQYSFENLSPGRYELSVNFKGVVHTQQVELGDDNLFAIEPFALPPDRKKAGDVPPDDVEAAVIGEA